MTDYTIVDGILRKVSSKRFEPEWQSYLKQVIPHDASDIQVTESKRAFYAGAQSLLYLILNILEPGTEPTENDLNTLSEIRQELLEFSKDVRRGRE